jgi:hypothetical protein
LHTIFQTYGKKKKLIQRLGRFKRDYYNGVCFRTALTVTATIFFLCSQAHAGQAKNSSQFKLKNETEG